MRKDRVIIKTILDATSVKHYVSISLKHNLKIMKTNLYYFFIPAIIMVFAFSCEKDDTVRADCVQGKYKGEYCEGAVIQILDDHKIGKDWESMYGDETYKNSVVASIDSLMAKSLNSSDSYFSIDSVFYFRYVGGGYPRKQYNICEPSASITITFVSKNPCQNNEK